eukprot:m.490154 g.490154  ORF g.490154 m.490154 type:complete len:131 (-) comp98628_c0_seq1:264-656(-)
MTNRDPVTNQLMADPGRFPGGIAALSEKIHKLGLKFGVYNDIGRTTCAGNPGLNVSDVDDVTADAQLKRDCDLMANVWKIDSIKVMRTSILYDFARWWADVGFRWTRSTVVQGKVAPTCLSRTQNYRNNI